MSEQRPELVERLRLAAGVVRWSAERKLFADALAELHALEAELKEAREQLRELHERLAVATEQSGLPWKVPNE